MVKKCECGRDFQNNGNGYIQCVCGMTYHCLRGIKRKIYLVESGGGKCKHHMSNFGYELFITRENFMVFVLDHVLPIKRDLTHIPLYLRKKKPREGHGGIIYEYGANIGNLRGEQIENIKQRILAEEIQPLCANCHEIKKFKEKDTSSKRKV